MNNQSMKKKCKKILTGIVNAISILVIAAAIWILLSVVMTKPGQTPSILGFSMFRVMTGSMEPEIRTDALIVVKKQDPGTLAIGDVISFYSHDPALYGMVNTHRIVEIEEEGGSRTFYTKGDANRIADKYPVSQNDVIGRVVFNSYGIGVMVRLLANPMIFIPLVLIPMGGIIIWNLIKSISLARKLMREEEEAAVREAIETIRQRRQEEGDVTDGGSPENQKRNETEDGI